jgi:hypothetical protein
MPTDEDVLSPAMTALLQLFSTDLSGQRFGEIDRPALEAAAAVVRTAAQELAEVELMADAARTSLESARDALLQKGMRALAYAKIYAEGSPALAEKLQSIALARGMRRPEPITATSPEAAPRPRGRPPKNPAAVVDGTLPLTAAQPRRPEEEAAKSAAPQSVAL